MSDRSAYLALVGIACGLGAALVFAAFTHEQGAAVEPAATGLVLGAASPSSALQTEEDRSALLSPSATSPTQAAEGGGLPSAEWRDAGSSPAGGTFYGALDPLGDVSALVPTPTGLYLMTVDLWDEEEFRAALREDWIDALPTLEDCRRGLQDDEALTILSDALSQERVCVHMESLPVSTPDDERVLVVMRERWKATCRKLMCRLDLVSGYAYWSVVSKSYEEWVAE